MIEKLENAEYVEKFKSQELHKGFGPFCAGSKRGQPIDNWGQHADANDRMQHFECFNG